MSKVLSSIIALKIGDKKKFAVKDFDPDKLMEAAKQSGVELGFVQGHPDISTMTSGVDTGTLFL